MNVLQLRAELVEMIERTRDKIDALELSLTKRVLAVVLGLVGTLMAGLATWENLVTRVDILEHRTAHLESDLEHVEGDVDELEGEGGWFN